MSRQKKQYPAANTILNYVRNDARLQAAAECRQGPEHHSVNADRDCLLAALIDVRSAEKRAGNQNPHKCAPRPADELALQISAEDRFLTNACRNGKHQPDGQFEQVFRGHEPNALHVLPAVQKISNNAQYNERAQLESRGNSKVPKHFTGPRPSRADQFPQRGSVSSHAEHDVDEDDPLKNQSLRIKYQVIRMGLCAHVNRGKPPEVHPHAENHQQAERMKCASHRTA